MKSGPVVAKAAASLLLPAFLAGIVSLALNRFIAYDRWYLDLVLFFLPVGALLDLLYFKRRNSDDFTQMLLVCLVVKMLAALIIIVVYALLDKTRFFGFGIHFIIHFVLFTIFEIWYVKHLIQIKSNTHA